MGKTFGEDFLLLFNLIVTAEEGDSNPNVFVTDVNLLSYKSL